MTALIPEAEDLIGAVAEVTGHSRQQVRDTFDRYRIDDSPAPGTTSPLILDRLTFRGVYPPDINDGSPFQFAQTFTSGVWAITSPKNLAGKTSILEIIFWALRGTPRDLQEDVRRWLDQVQLKFRIGTTDVDVSFDVDDGRPAGTLTARGHEPLGFHDDRSFAAVMDAFMLSNLGLQRLVSWRDDTEGAGGAPTSHGWAALSGGLYVANATQRVLLGEHTEAGLAGRLLLMYLGTPWTSAYMTSQTATKQIASEVATRQRRAGADTEARSAGVAELQRRAQELQEELDDAGNTVDDVLARFEVDVAALQQLSGQIADLRVRIADARRELREARLGRLDEERAGMDIIETRLAARFFRSLRPEMCPRCDVPIDDERREQERVDHQCSVCAAPINFDLADTGESGVDEYDDDDDDDDGATLRSRLDAAREAERAAAEHVETLERELQILSASYNAARSSAVDARNAARSARRSRDVELELAQNQGALAERRQALELATGQPPVDDNLVRHQTIAKTAHDGAKSRMYAADQALFDELNAEIARLGRKFGIDALTSVTVDRAARLRVAKGGTTTNFGSLSRGERLRLRVATIVALLRVADRYGIGRHPGFLMIDSPAAEEASADDAIAMLSELKRVADELPHLQVIAATARPDLVVGTIDDDHIVPAGATGFMW